MKERGRTILSEIEPSYLRQRHLFSNRSFDLFGILGITKNISKLLYFREQYFQKFGTFLSGLELKDLTISYDLEAPNIFPSDPPTHLWTGNFKVYNFLFMVREIIYDSQVKIISSPN